MFGSPGGTKATGCRVGGGGGGLEMGYMELPRKLGTFFIWISSFFSSGRSKKALAWVMTSLMRASEMPVLLM